VRGETHKIGGKMTTDGWLTTFHVLSFLGAIIVVISGIGIWYFGNKIENENNNKINTLLEQSTAYLADLRSKDAEIKKLKSSVKNMEPALSLLEFKLDESKPNEATLILGASYPVDLRYVNLIFEFTSSIISAERSVIGSGSVQCNFEDPKLDGTRLILTGGPLNASNYLKIKVRTEEHIEIKSSNIKMPE